MPESARLPILETRRLVLYMPEPAAASEIVDYFERNRFHLDKWDPARPASFYTNTYWEQQLLRNQDEFHRGATVRFFVSEAGKIIGTANFTGIVRGAAHMCVLGYGIDAQHEGTGKMREALSICIAYMFDVQRMHRIQAGYVPTNDRSGRLLRRLGFVTEGYARQYLFIGGEWRDHVLTALVNPAWRSESAT